MAGMNWNRPGLRRYGPKWLDRSMCDRQPHPRGGSPRSRTAKRRTPRPVTPESIEAMEFLVDYDGDFPFLVDLKKCLAADPKWWPTAKQTTAILSCRRWNRQLEPANA